MSGSLRPGWLLYATLISVAAGIAVGVWLFGALAPGA